ncbi:63 kDa sperm flagellar membrane protein-like [Diadema setosum]|uniref:63 kDa sperm flagellar membrane protein-like n=1 Tax=Diadema setosum TaxID=31175 RepID=UPI003B3AFE7B
MESENGTAVYCPNARDTCYTTIQMNPEGDGFMIRKGCMDLDECYDAMYSDMNDPNKASCFTYIWPYGADTPPGPGLQCHYCSNEWLPLDLSNNFHISLMYGVPRINNWDPRMNWDLTMDYVTPTAPPSDDGVRPLPLAFGQLLGVVASVTAVYVFN